MPLFALVSLLLDPPDNLPLPSLFDPPPRRGVPQGAVSASTVSGQQLVVRGCRVAVPRYRMLHFFPPLAAVDSFWVELPSNQLGCGFRRGSGDE